MPEQPVKNSSSADVYPQTALTLTSDALQIWYNPNSKSL